VVRASDLLHRAVDFVGELDMSAQLDNLLSLLSKARRTGPDSYIGCCPAHEDRHPSLTIRESSETIVLRCQAGCETESVLSAIGLSFSDLYPPRQHHGKPNRRPFPAADILRALSFETLIVAQAGRMLLEKRPYSEADQERLVTAAHRIQSALSAGGINHV
jgi:CHC2 zinc finger